MTTATRSGMPNAHQGFMAELGSATCGRAGPPGRGLAVGVPLGIVQHAEGHPFEVWNARRQQAFGPDDATRIDASPRRLPDQPEQLGTCLTR
jgi:hypothetical protein